jgi:hypothetical protein
MRLRRAPRLDSSFVIPGRAYWRQPGIDNHKLRLWIPGPAQVRRPGMTEVEKTNTGEASLSGANSLIVGQAIVIVGRLNSERSQQNSANKNKRGAHSQYIQSQGSVHGACLPC